MKKRPLGVMVLVVLVVIGAALACVHALQALGIVPFIIGPFSVHTFSFWSFLMWALMVWVYLWLAQMLLDVDPKAWMFLAIVTVLNLTLDCVVMLGSGEWSDVSVSFILNAIILIYIMLPGVKKAFDMN
jgi:hypothetical protein